MARPQYAVIGDPIAHSLSPALFARAFARLGLEADYAALRVPATELDATLARVRSGELAGLSVTLPHKLAVAARAEVLDPTARLLGAANCVWAREGKLHAANTDAPGLARSLRRTGWDLAGKPGLVLGAGGAARAAVLALLELGVTRIRVANRTLARAVELANALAGPVRAAGALLEVVPHPAVRLEEEEWAGAVIINASSVGMGTGSDTGDPLNRLAILHGDHRVVDLVYRPLATPLLRRAWRQEAQTLDGLWMLVDQALLQLELWTGAATDDAFARELHDTLFAEAR